MFFFKYANEDYNVLPMSKIKMGFYGNAVFYLGIFVALLIISKLLEYPSLAIMVVFILGTGFLFYTVKKMYQFDGCQRESLLACFYLTIFSIIFEILFQQSAMSMMVFVEHNVHRHVAGWEVPAMMSQALNPLFIILLAPLLSNLWLFLDKKNYKLTVPMKFAAGMLLTGVGFAIFPFIIRSSHVHYGWVVLSYFLQSIGELLISPIGLSMLTEKSPPQILGVMIGVWYFSMAIGQALAGVVSQLTIITSYSLTFGLAGGLAITTGLVLLMMVPKFNRMLAY